jgi:membrane protein required for colicin V production
MEINYFDLIAAIIILLLGLKGILNGFFKELFGLIGIIGGIFVASRMGGDVGEYLNNLIFHFSNNSAIGFTGFLVTLALFWLLMVGVGYAFKKLSSLSGLGIVDRIFGFVFGASKFFLIAAVIAFAVNNVKALKPTLESTFSNSILFPVLVSTGGVIMKIDPADINASVTQSTQKVSQALTTKAKELTQDQIQTNITKIKNELKEEN